MSTLPSTDAKAVVVALARLTTQVGRIADTLATPVVDHVDATDDDTETGVRCPLCPVAVPLANPQQATDHFQAQHPEQRLNTSGAWPLLVADDGSTTPATTCSAQHHGFDDGRLCIRAAQHHGDHIDERGYHWSDTVAVYPLADSTVRVAHWHPVAELRAEEQQELSGKVSEFIDAQVRHARATGVDPTPEWLRHGSRDLSIREQAPAAGDATCRRMETRTCPQAYNGPCGGRPCARFESDDPTPWLDTAASPATDEEQTLRWTRRESLLVLLTRLQRGRALTEEEAGTLRQHVETEIREADTARSVAAGNRRHVQTIVPEIDRLAAELEAADRIRAEAQRDRDQHAAVLAEALRQFTEKGHPGAPCLRSSWVREDTVARWRSVVAPTAERPWWQQVAMYEREAVEATRHVLELKATIERVLKAMDDRPPCRDGQTGEPASSYEAGWRDHDRMVRTALDSPDETEQPR